MISLVDRGAWCWARLGEAVSVRVRVLLGFALVVSLIAASGCKGERETEVSKAEKARSTAEGSPVTEGSRGAEVLRGGDVPIADDDEVGVKRPFTTLQSVQDYSSACVARVPKGERALTFSACAGSLLVLDGVHEVSSGEAESTPWRIKPFP